MSVNKKDISCHPVVLYPNKALIDIVLYLVSHLKVCCSYSVHCLVCVCTRVRLYVCVLLYVVLVFGVFVYVCIVCA